MRVVTYARVSTKRQSDRGVSLDDQESRFKRWLERSGHHRLHLYTESRSAKSFEQRRTWQRMLDDLPRLKPDAVVVDSLDRYTRSVMGGWTMFSRLKDLGVKLMELEYNDSRPLDLTDDDDHRYIQQKFSDAEGEHRRMKKRQLKRYQEQRERNATCTNRPAFGLKLDGLKGAKRLVPHPDNAAIVKELDKRALRGESHRHLQRWVASLNIKGSWRTRTAVSSALRNEGDCHNYVASGLRSPEVQYRLREVGKAKYGADRAKRFVDHPLSGLVACGECVRAGIEPAKALMAGRYVRANEPYPLNLVCEAHRKGKRIHQRQFFIAMHKALELWLDRLQIFTDAKTAKKVLALWQSVPRETTKTDELRISLERRLELCDEDEQDLEKRANGALRLASDPDLADEARRLLKRVGDERREIAEVRESLRQQLSELPVSIDRSREVDELAELRDIALNWDLHSGFSHTPDGVLDASSLRPYLKRWVAVLGNPIIERAPRTQLGWRSSAALRWPKLDTVKSQMSSSSIVRGLTVR